MYCRIPIGVILVVIVIGSGCSSRQSDVSTETTSSSDTIKPSPPFSPVSPQRQFLVGGKIFTKIDWTKKELTKELAYRKVKETPLGTYLFIRATKPDKEHVHNNNDITAYGISGEGTFYMDGNAYPFRPGDVITIPKGTAHYVTLAKGTPALEAYVILSPKKGENWKRYIDEK